MLQQSPSPWLVLLLFSWSVTVDRSSSPDVGLLYFLDCGALECVLPVYPAASYLWRSETRVKRRSLDCSSHAFASVLWGFSFFTVKYFAHWLRPLIGRQFAGPRSIESRRPETRFVVLLIVTLGSNASNDIRESHFWEFPWVHFYCRTFCSPKTRRCSLVKWWATLVTVQCHERTVALVLRTFQAKLTKLPTLLLFARARSFDLCESTLFTASHRYCGGSAICNLR